MAAAKIVSFIALVALLLPSILYCFGVASLPATQVIALVATVVWFCASPLWMGRDTAS